jgi:uncharacterized integral membrane protein
MTLSVFIVAHTSTVPFSFMAAATALPAATLLMPVLPVFQRQRSSARFDLF